MYESIFKGKSQEEIETMLIEKAVQNFFDDGHETEDTIYNYFIEVYEDNDEEPDPDLLEKLAKEAKDALYEERNGIR